MAERIYIEGNTYPIKDQLKALGCRWDGARRAWYTEDKVAGEQALALLAPAPIYNSPPPQDLGTADPVALAAQYGRTAVAGVTVRSVTVYGLARGDNGTPNGHVTRRPDGRVYVQVGRSARHYLSRDMLEDFDLFGQESGGSVQYDMVEVEPTAEERAETERKAQEAAEAKRQKEEAATQAKAAQESRLAAWDAAKVGLVRTCASPVGEVKKGEERLTISEDKRSSNTATRITLADGSQGWCQQISGSDNWRTYYYLTADAARAANLQSARQMGITLEKAQANLAEYRGCEGTEVWQAVVDATPAEQAEIAEAARAKAEAKLVETRERERRDVQVCAESEIKKASLANLPLAGWSLEIEEEFEEYVAYMASGQSTYNRPQAQGLVLVLRLLPEAYGKKGELKPSVARLVPATVKLHNFATATVKVEKAS